jgi:acyl-CoA dehydrogenase family member 9
MLDFGRNTFGASCTGAAKTCLRAAVRHAKTRIQFKQKLSEFELVKKKIAYMAACAFAMEATTSQCASFIDRGFEDSMLETAMLKVWSTEALWQIVNDTIQIYGGQAYFTDEPYERRMRDGRSNRRERRTVSGNPCAPPLNGTDSWCGTPGSTSEALLLELSEKFSN